MGADQRVRLRSVSISRDLGKVVEIGSGLAANDQVIESPPDGLTDGTLVRIATTMDPALAAKTK